MSPPIPDWIYHLCKHSTPQTLEQLPRYTETWLSPAAVYRNWSQKEEIPVRFRLEIDIADQASNDFQP